MARSSIIDRDLGYRRVSDDIHALRQRPAGVKLGVRQEAGIQRVATEGKPGERRAVEGGPDDPSLAEVATFNEFGLGVPERSYMRSTFDEKRGHYSRVLQAGVERVVDGNDDIELVLELLGIEMVGDIQDKIRDLDTPPNADATIAKKGSSNPLQDSGRLRQSIDYQLDRGVAALEEAG